MVGKRITKSFATHDGSFHADEVTACALLLIFGLIEKDKIYRTRENSVLKCCAFVCDVGGEYDPRNRLFDHHQASYKGSLSGAGMILLYLRDHKFISEGEYRFLNDSFIIGVDAQDNGKYVAQSGVATYSDVIANFAPIREDAAPEDLDRAFFGALEFALEHLGRLRARYNYIKSCEKIVGEAMRKGGDFLYFDTAIPWMEPFFKLGGARHPAKFVIIPAGGQWNLRGIPPSNEDRMRVRMSLPASWAGLSDGELRKISGIEGAVFCHKERFISVWASKEDAFRALEYTLNNEGQKI